MGIQFDIYTIVALVGIAYVLGVLTYWRMARRNRRALKYYRLREQVLRQWNRLVE